MDTSDLLSLAALVISIVSSVLTYRLSTITYRSDLRPVLVFVFNDNASHWHLKNVGKGPALNITIAKRKEKGEWYGQTRVFPISDGDELSLSFWGPVDAPEAGVVYEDFRGNEYTSIVKADLSKTYEGRKLPEWEEDQINRWWR